MKKVFFLFLNGLSSFTFFCLIFCLTCKLIYAENKSSSLVETNESHLSDIRSIDPRFQIKSKSKTSQNQRKNSKKSHPFHSKSNQLKKWYQQELALEESSSQQESLKAERPAYVDPSYVNPVQNQKNSKNVSRINTKKSSIEGHQEAPQGQSPVQIQTPTIVAPQHIQSVTVQTPVSNQSNSNSSATQNSGSGSNQLRKLRERSEKQTQERILENLEMSRINEERKRQQKIMNKLYELEHGTPLHQDKRHLEIKKQRIEKSKEMTQKTEEESNVLPQTKKSKKSFGNQNFFENSFISATAGLSSYFNVKNIDQTYGAGFGYGYRLNDNITLEGSFLYAQHKVLQYYGFSEIHYQLKEEKIYVNLNQYIFSFQANYNLRHQASLIPYFGVSVASKYRHYTGIGVNVETDDDEEDQLTAYRKRETNSDKEKEIQRNGTAKTVSLDLGGVLGLDFNILPRVFLGVEYKYELNLLNTNSKKTTYLPSGKKVQSIEAIYQWFLGLKLKVLLK